MTTMTIEPPHLETDLKTLCLSTVAAQWRPLAEQAADQRLAPAGTGKTHLSIALGMACCQYDYRVRFLTAAELVTLLVEAQQQGRLQRKLDQLARYDAVMSTSWDTSRSTRPAPRDASRGRAGHREHRGFPSASSTEKGLVSRRSS